MTSFADTNSSILKSRKIKYNAYVSSAEEQSIREENVAQQRSTDSDLVSVLRRAAKQSRLNKERRNQEFRIKNSQKIRSTLRAGTNKTEYSYEEYDVKENNFPVGFAAVVVVLTIISVFLLMNYSQITKFNSEINSLEAQLSKYNESIAELDIYINKCADHSTIERFAKDNNMVTSEKVESCYITMTDSYKITKSNISEPTVTLGTVMSGIVKLFGEVLN